ncbi:hypothetical protein H0H87_001318 [Tephrocybe sp. NHM501043]|nr:hypothetical protein H0H87_001318 [Tephrocybe sp. NHM501043]
MLNNDVTFACLHAGVYEMVVMRDRADNTLYVSKILRNNEAGFAKRQTGLFIAMLRDAQQRASRIAAPVISSAKNSKCQARAVKVNKKPFVDPDGHEAKQRSLLDNIRKCRWVVMDCPSEEPGAYKRNSPYIRASPYEPLSRWTFGEFYRIKASPHINLSLEATIQIRGDNFQGTLNFGKHVVVKCAGVDSHTKDNLRNEAAIYKVLDEAGVACDPQLLGFCRHANLEGRKDQAEWMVLVLENVGSHTVKYHKRTDVIQRFEIVACLEGLRSIHAADVCLGIENISLQHIIIKDRGPRKFIVAFVGFKGAKMCADNYQKEMEVQKLFSLLDDPSLKRKASAIL